MNKNKKHVAGLIENFFYDCEQNGVSDFNTWCEDNIENGAQLNILELVYDSVQQIAEQLYE